MATDALITLATSATVTATTHGTALVLPGGTPRRGLKARVLYSAATQASGSGVWTFGLSVSYDAGSTWNADFISNEKAVTLTTTAQSGEFAIPFDVSPTSVANGTQVRIDAVLSGTPTTPTITFGAEIQLGRP